jgi:hypothetical protein
MAEVRFDRDVLTVDFPGWESLMVRRRSYAVPVTAITGVEVLEGWTSEVLGFRTGLVVSGFRKVATFRHPSGVRRLVSMKRGLPLLRIGLRDREAGQGFDELLLSTPDGEAIAGRIREAVTA